MKINIEDLRIGDVIEISTGQKVEITSLTIMTGDTVGYRINPNSRIEMSIDISGVVRKIGRFENGVTYDVDGKKIVDYMYL